MYKLVQRAVLAGLGARVKLNQWVDELVEQGAADPNREAVQVRAFVDECQKNAQKVEQAVKDGVSSITKTVRLPNRADFEALERKVHELSQKLDSLSQRL